MMDSPEQIKTDIATLKTRRANAPEWAHKMLDKWITQYETELADALRVAETIRA